MAAIDYPILILITGLLIVLAMLVKLAFERAGLPALVGYLVIGFLLRAANEHFGFLSPDSEEILKYLGTVGLAVLLFRVGLESNLAGLVKQLPKASLIWIGDILISAGVGFAAAFYLLHLSWITALIVGVALSATSVGISVGAWQNAGALDSEPGEFLLDVAELDDISAVFLMALLFSLLPEIHAGSDQMLVSLAFHSTAVFLAKLIAFVLVCLLFSRYVEKPVTHYLAAQETPPDPMLSVVAIGFIFAALAGMLGFSIAIGAFLVGLVFSRDPEAVKMDASFQPVYELFSPFFFISIGLEVDPGVLGEAVFPGAVLLLVAVIGKLLADGLPVMLFKGRAAAVLIGASMVPRAEIAMVIISRGRSLGDWAVPLEVYSAMVMVCALTCLCAPLAVRTLLKRYPPEEQT